MTPEVFEDLANRCEREYPSWELSLDIARALGQAPTRCDASWHYSGEYAAAFSITDWVLLTLSDISADGVSYCRFVNPECPDAAAYGMAGRTRILTIAAAALRARAVDCRRGVR